LSSKYWKQQEYRIRDILRKRGWKANRVPVSGAAEGFKGDVIADLPFLNRRLVVDHKSTRGKDSITIKRKDLEKLFDMIDEFSSIESLKDYDNYGAATFSFLSCRNVYAIIPFEELLRLYENSEV